MNKFIVRDGKRILQCHSRGDKRFSPLFCYVSAFGFTDTIENFYQKSKLFIDTESEIIKIVTGNDWKTTKAIQSNPRYKRNDSFFILPYGKLVPIKYQIYGWYSGLWCKYLDEHPNLVKEATEYDDYEDIFKHSFPLCQADCIRLYVKEGRDALYDLSKEFFEFLGNYGT